MADLNIARVAVSGLPLEADRAYDYFIPAELRHQALPGCRVSVPFGKGNRVTEALILARKEQSDFEKLKPISKVLDPEPVLTADQITLALWMRSRFFCTVYEAVKAILPAGLWFKNGTRRVSEKTVETARLSLPAEEALEAAERKHRRAPMQAEILRTLCSVGSVSVAELLEFTGASRTSLKPLVAEGYVETERIPVFRRPVSFSGETAPLPSLTDAQRAAYEGILRQADDKASSCALLYGVTGSGKTTVYINLIAEMLRRGRGAILLVPEIALTPQMIKTFSSHFGNGIAVLHSSLSSGERYDEWRRLISGEARVAIGARSAVFAPVRDLGIIIIDEEQEDTYKSENAPRYHARDVAKKRCAMENALLLLGSATPDVESRWLARSGRYGFFTLPERFNERPLPEVTVVDMKRELRRGNGGSVSLFLRDELQKNIDAGEQSILFLNRRGANKLITCAECGYTYRCPRCSVSLTYHSFERKLMCHYCGYWRRPDDKCPDCGGRLSYQGVGTQKVEEELTSLFPGEKILRVDSDTVSAAGGHESLFERFRAERIPIMIGTQMVTKGLNFENVTLVGVLNADQSLYSGDFRASERTFSLITQVVGRSGRFDRAGRAVIQTFTPGNEVIKQAARQDYESFFSSEIELRRLQYSPPFSELMCVTASGEDENLCLQCATELRDSFLATFGSIRGVRVLGPAPLSVLRVNNRYRYRVTLCAPVGAGLRARLLDITAHFSRDKRYKALSVYADGCPLD